MSTTPAEAQDIRRVWFTVDRSFTAQLGPTWELLADGDSTVTDIAAMVLDLGLTWQSSDENPVRVRVWDNSLRSGDPISEHFAPATSAPWTVPPARMADPTAESEELPQRTPEDVPPPLRAVPSVPPDDDTLYRVRDGLKDKGPEPVDGDHRYHAPPLVVVDLPDDADVPEGLRELFKAAKVNMERAAREAIREHRMIEAANALHGAIADAQRHAETHHSVNPWSECVECLTLVALAASHFTAAYVLARTAV